MRVHSTTLRNAATAQENRLWYEFLRQYPVRVNRQRIIGEYIADFYCAKAKVVIEVDGNQHLETQIKEYDAIRTAYLSALGIQVLRFSNAEIDDGFDGVCGVIDAILHERASLS